jgi:molecular chaperone DnaK
MRAARSAAAQATGSSSEGEAASVASPVRATARAANYGGSSNVVSSVLGISLGDTTIRLALTGGEGGGPARVVESAEGQRGFAAVYLLARDGERILGLPALRRRFEPGAAVVLCATTMLGERADSAVAKGCAELLSDSAPLASDADGRAAFTLHGSLRLPEELCASLLESVKAAAAAATGKPVWRAVLALHAGASEAHVAAARAAALDIGLFDVAVVSAPVAAYEAAREAAAAGAHGADASAAPQSSSSSSSFRFDRPALVVHVGGRRASASVVSPVDVPHTAARLLASRQRLFAGGEQHDAAVVERLAAQFFNEHKIDLRADHFALSRLHDAAERARHELSAAPTTVINLPFITADASGPKHLRRELGRSEFEAVADGFLADFAIDKLCTAALADAGVRAADLGALVLTGGMMRTPHLRARVERTIGRGAFESGINPEDLSAVGATLAVFAPRGQAATAADAQAGAAEEGA